MDTKVRELSGEQITLLPDLAQLVVDELELRLAASTDSLTGAMSRRSFIERARGDIKRSKRHENPLCCIVLDLDHFKKINDSYGHSAGDVALLQLVSVCQSRLRASDYLGRIRGEEFAIMLPERTAGTPSVERLLEETANVAMYDAKGSGRNRVAGFLGAGLKSPSPQARYSSPSSQSARCRASASDRRPLNVRCGRFGRRNEGAAELSPVRAARC